MIRIFLILLSFLVAVPTIALEPQPPLMRAPSQVALKLQPEYKFGMIENRLTGMDETGAVYGMYQDEVRCWTKGATSGKTLMFTEQPGKPPGRTWLGMAHDKSHAIAARLADGTLQMVSLRCDQAVKPAWTVLTVADEPLLATLLPETWTKPGGKLTTTPAGDWCFQLQDTVHCYGADKKIVRSFAVKDAWPAIDLHPEWALDMTIKPRNGTTPAPPNEQWSVVTFTFAPDGRLFALVRQDLGVANSQWVTNVLWLVEQAQDGKVTARTTAIPSTGCDYGQHSTPLTGVTQLVYDSKRKSILAFPVFGWDLKDNEQQSTSKVNGTPPVGMRVFPLDGGFLHGYLSMTKVVGDWLAAVNAGQQGGWQMFEAPDGRLLLELAQNVPGAKPPEATVTDRLFEVQIDDAAADLDLDGLTAAEEAKAGTSDFLQDSDGGGDADRIELIAGTNPTDGKDDPGREFDLHKTAYSLGGLLSWRLGNPGSPPPTSDPWLGVTNGGQRLDPYPFCIAGTCRARTGELILTYPTALEWDPPQSADGTMLLLRQDEQYLALHVPEGVTKPLVPVADIEQLVGPGLDGVGVNIQAALPAGRKEVYFRRLEGRRIVLAGDGPPRVVFDLDALVCSSGLGCPNDQGYSKYRYLLDWIGYDGKLGRLVVTVKEFQNNLGRGWLIGVHPTLPPVLLAHPMELWGAAKQDFVHDYSDCDSHSHAGMGLPAWLVDTGHGDLLTDYGRRDPFLRTLPSYFEIFGDPVRRAFGDTLVQIVDGKLYEAVQVPERVDPGELLAFTYEDSTGGSEHGTLWHINARGGKGKVFELPKVKVTGMNVAKDGRICLAAPEPGVYIQARNKPLSFGLQGLLQAELAVGKVVDCDFGPDGRAHLLMTDPPRVLVWNGKTDTKNPGAPEDFETRLLDPNKMPFQLLVQPDGQDYVLYEGGSALGMGRMQDGSIAELETDSKRLKIHGQLVGPDLYKWVNDLGTSKWKLEPGSMPSLRVHVAQRPDGLVAVLPYQMADVPLQGVLTAPPTTVLVVHPGTGQAGQLTPRFDMGMHNPHALAVVPGGEARDPWTGQPMGVVAEPDAGGTDAAATDAAATDAGPGNEAVAPKNDGGCQAGRTGDGMHVAWLLLAAVCLRLRRAATQVRAAA